MSRALLGGRRAAGRIKRKLFPKAEQAAWNKLARVAMGTPRYTSGVVDVMGYRLHYVDLLTIPPQWKDTFVDELHAFDTDVKTPRVLDCGANVGVVTLYLKRRYPDASITAFEADPAIAATLARNVEENHLSRVDIIAAAVWDSVGETTFVAEGADSGGVAADYRGSSRKRITVPTVRLRDILATETRVDLLKLDVEGAEHRVLADCESELGKVRAIAVELHDFDIENRRSPATLELLSRAGFLYAHGGTVPVPGFDNGVGAGKPFSAPAAKWVERVYAWRE
ncbi:MAG TPA: FkbM family methyltransferase [Gemmatimonadaceae bacterium]|nr:FkbM family methyltransferase [Gemmatimonadaceae bacterium]